MAIHDRAYNRSKTFSKAIRKYHIDRDRAAGRWELFYNNLHQYADNKIHCSCKLCAAKRRTNSAKEYAISDQKRIARADEQINELRE